MFFKIIALILIGLTPNDLAANELNKKEETSFESILLSQINDSNGRIIKTVIASGYGLTIEAASQNAAKNALTEVVGSFIDTETIIKEKTTINNGILEQSNIIKEEISDYSQGSIKYFEILNINQNGSIFNVTAKVDVRVEDFKAYIKKLAFGSSAVSKEVATNLFTKAVVSAENLKNKYDLLIKNVVDPIRRGEVYQIQSGDIISLDDFQDNYDLCKRNPTYSPCKKNGLYNNWDRNRTYVFPFTISLENNFKENMINTLDNISDKKIDNYNINSFASGYIASDSYSQYYDRAKDWEISIYSPNYKNKTTYILRDVLTHWKKISKIQPKTKYTILNLGSYYFANPSIGNDDDYCKDYKNYFNPLLLRIIGKDNQTLANYEYSLFACGSKYSYPISIIEPYSINSRTYGGNIRYSPKLSLLASGQALSDEKAIFLKREYFIVAELELEIMKNFRGIEIEYLQNNQ